MTMKLKAAALICAVTLGSTAAQAVDFTGQSVTGSFSSAAQASLITPFSSPQTVGAGTEFSGSFQDVFSQIWTVDVDVYDKGFILKIGETTNNGNGNVASSPALAISLNGLIGGSSISLLNYNCTGTAFACGTFSSGPSITSKSYSGSQADVSLGVIRDGETYNFSLASVPEPAAWLLLISGFGLLGMGLRAQRSRFGGYQLAA